MERTARTLALVITATVVGAYARPAAAQDSMIGYKAGDDVRPDFPVLVHSLLLRAQEGAVLVQSDKNSGDDPRGGPAGEFVCYKAKCTGTAPPVTVRNSQFGVHALETKKTKLVCLPADPPCTGEIVGAGCWYLGAPGASCDATCAAVGKTCDSFLTSIAGDLGTNADCLAVLTAFGVSIASDFPACSAGVGCATQFGLAVRCLSPATTCSAAGVGVGSVVASRACACQ